MNHRHHESHYENLNHNIRSPNALVPFHRIPNGCGPLRPTNLNDGIFYPRFSPEINQSPRNFFRQRVPRFGRPNFIGHGQPAFRPPNFQPCPPLFPARFGLDNNNVRRHRIPFPNQPPYFVPEEQDMMHNNGNFAREPYYQNQLPPPVRRSPVWELPNQVLRNNEESCHREVEHIMRSPVFSNHSSPERVSRMNNFSSSSHSNSMEHRYYGNGNEHFGNNGHNLLESSSSDEEYHPEPVCKKRHRMVGDDYIPFSSRNLDYNNNSPNGESSRAFKLISSNQDRGDNAKRPEEFEKAIQRFLQNHITEVKLISPSNTPLPSQFQIRNNCYYDGEYLQVSIFGYCKTQILGNGKFGPVASYGICFKDGNEMNIGGCLRSYSTQTACAAELLAAERCIKIVKHTLKENVLNINTESKYIVENVRSWLKRIKSENGQLVLEPENWVEYKHLTEIKRLCNSFENMKIQWTLIGHNKISTEFVIARDLSMQRDSIVEDFNETNSDNKEINSSK